jgi:hypothetical protein
VKWVKLKKYLDESGDTPDAVQKKIARGLWIENHQFKDAPDGVRWYNLEAIEAWVEKGAAGAQGQQTRPKASMSGSSATGLASRSTSDTKASAAANA